MTYVFTAKMVFWAVVFFVVIYGAVTRLGKSQTDALFLGTFFAVGMLSYSMHKGKWEFFISSLLLICAMLWLKYKQPPRII